MGRRITFRWVVVAAMLCGMLASARSETSQTNEVPQPPPAKTVTYTDTNGVEHLYLVQEPLGSTSLSDAPILIYMHGAGGKEEQGMHTLFPDLRPLMNEWGWTYVCPRDADFAGLRRDLTERYGKRTLYLAGASAGGRAVLWEALAHPTQYSGLILMCPAVVRKTLQKAVDADAKSLPMPVWMICGELDTYYADTCRFLQQVLERRNTPAFYLQIPGGNHNVPCLQIRWEDALRFVARKVEEQGGGKGENDKAGPMPNTVSEDTARKVADPRNVSKTNQKISAESSEDIVTALRNSRVSLSLDKVYLRDAVLMLNRISGLESGGEIHCSSKVESIEVSVDMGDVSAMAVVEELCKQANVKRKFIKGELWLVGENE